MLMRFPRNARRSASGSANSDAPLKRMSPPAMRASGASNPSTASAVVLLPEPDSPTTPSARPAPTSNDTSSSAPSQPSPAG